MNRDKALSSTYTTVLKFHAKVIGSSPPGSFGPLEKNMAKKRKKKKKRRSNSLDKDEEEEEEDDYGELPSFDDC